MKRFFSIFIWSVVSFTMFIVGLLTVTEKTYASINIDDEVKCFTRQKWQNGKAFTPKATKIKVKLKDIWIASGTAPKVKEIKLFDADTKKSVKKFTGSMSKGKTVTFGNLEENKEYYLQFSLKNKSNNCVKVSYTIDPVEDVTKDYKFYPSYKNGTVYVTPKKVSNKKAQAISGKVILSSGEQTITVNRNNSKQPMNLNHFKPFSDQTKKIKIYFEGKIGNKEVMINHTVHVVHYKKTSITKENNKNNVKITVKLPQGLSHKDGELKIRLYDKDKKEEITNVSPKLSNSYNFGKKFFEGKNVQVSATFKGSKVNNLTVYIADIWSQKVYNDKPTVLPVVDDQSGRSDGNDQNNRNNNNSSNDNNNSDDKKNEVEKVEIQATSTFLGDQKLVVKTSVPKKNDVKGDWVVEVGESKKSKDDQTQEITTFEFPISELKAKDGLYPLKVTFNGKAGDQEIQGERKKNLVFITSGATAKGNQVTAHASLKGVEEASGDWKISYDGVTTSKQSTEKEISVPFHLSDAKAEKEMMVTFKGKVNDKTVEGKIQKIVKPNVEEDAKDEECQDTPSSNIIRVSTQSENPNCKQDEGTSNNNRNHDNERDEDQNTDDENNETNSTQTEQKDPDESNTDQMDSDQESTSESRDDSSNEEQEHNEPSTKAPETENEVKEEFMVTQASENNQIGGKLPKTATTYHTGILAGTILFLSGLFIFWLRRKPY